MKNEVDANIIDKDSTISSYDIDSIQSTNNFEDDKKCEKNQ